MDSEALGLYTGLSYYWDLTPGERDRYILNENYFGLTILSMIDDMIHVAIDIPDYYSMSSSSQVGIPIPPGGSMSDWSLGDSNTTVSVFSQGTGTIYIIGMHNSPEKASAERSARVAAEYP